MMDAKVDEGSSIAGMKSALPDITQWSLRELILADDSVLTSSLRRVVAELGDEDETSVQFGNRAG